MGVWRVVQRLGQAAANYSIRYEAVSRRSEGVSNLADGHFRAVKTGVLLLPGNVWKLPAVSSELLG